MLSSLKSAAALASRWKCQRCASKALSSPSAGNNMPSRLHNPESWEVIASHPSAWQSQRLTNSKGLTSSLKAARNRQLHVSACSVRSDLCCTSNLNGMLLKNCPGIDREVLLLVWTATGDNKWAPATAPIQRRPDCWEYQELTTRTSRINRKHKIQNQKRLGLILKKKKKKNAATFTFQRTQLQTNIQTLTFCLYSAANGSIYSWWSPILTSLMPTSTELTFIMPTEAQKWWKLCLWP